MRLGSFSRPGRLRAAAPWPWFAPREDRRAGKRSQKQAPPLKPRYETFFNRNLSILSLESLQNGALACPKDAPAARGVHSLVLSRQINNAGEFNLTNRDRFHQLWDAPTLPFFLNFDLPNPALEGKSSRLHALVAQLDRASDYESEGWRFEPSPVYHF
jgi:hypothetical protein